MSTAATATAEPRPKASPAAAPTPVPSLDDRVLAALRDHAGSAEIRALIAEAETALVSAETQHAAARERAIDPTTPGEAVAEARRIMEDRAFIAERMREAARRLRDELKTAEAREAAAARDVEVKAFYADRDLLIRDLRAEYANAAGVIFGLIRRLERSDAELARLGLGIESGAEHQARNLPPNFYAPGGSPIPRIRDARLPVFHGLGFLWPQ